MRIDWKLKSILVAQNISVYSLARAMGNQTHAIKLYRITNADPAKRPRRVDLVTLEQIIPALETLTGKPVTPNDLLELIEEPVHEIDSETQAWLDMATEDTNKAIAAVEKDLPPKELAAWHESFRNAGQPAKYVVGKGIVLLKATA